MSFSKQMKKQIKVTEPKQQPNPFQVMEAMQDKIGHLAYNYAEMLNWSFQALAVSRTLEPESPEFESARQNSLELEAAIQIMKDRLNTNVKRLSKYALEFAASQKPKDEDLKTEI